MENQKQKIVPNLWFDGQAEEAVEFYSSIFQNSATTAVARYPGAGKEIHGREEGSVMTIEFSLEGYRLMALNGGPHFHFNPSVSLFVLCKSEEEIQRIWDRLLENGSEMMPLDNYDWSPRYGWLQDRYGLSWQLMLEEQSGKPTRIVPLLFFTGEKRGKAEAAIRHYTSIFSNSEIEGILHYGKENPFADGTVMHAQFQLEGQTFMAMDSGVENNYPFSEAVSFIVKCKDQEEIDDLWEKLGEDGDPAAQQCGWLKDKFGVSWQIVPEEMGKFFTNPDEKKRKRAMDAMMKMKKIDMAALEV